MKTPAADPRRGGRPSGIILLLLAGVTIAVFWRVCQLDFLNDWDDGEHISLNRDLNPVTLGSLAQYWVRPQVNLYIPVTFSVWAAVAGVARTGAPDDAGVTLNPWLFHGANLVMHVAVVMVVFHLLRRFVAWEWAACLGALLFAVHPMQVEPVAWASGMKDLLSGLMSFACLLLYVRTAQGPTPGGAGKRWAGYAGSAALFMLAMLAKPSAAAIPLVAAAIDRLLLRGPWRRVLPMMFAGLALALPVLWVTRGAQPAGALQFVAPLWCRPLVAADAVAFYVGKLLLPVHLLPDYGRSPWWLMHSFQVRWTWAVSALLAAAAWLARRRTPRLSAAFAIFVLAMAPVLGLVPFLYQATSTVADRYAYLAMLGPALALAAVIDRWGSRATVAGAATILAALAIRSYFQVPVWQDEQTLFKHELSLVPYSLVGNTVLGTIAARQGMTTQAVDHALAAAHSVPDSPRKFLEVGRLLASRGRRDEAIDAYRQALRLDPANTQATDALAALNQPASGALH
jgi:hypothetical protein